MTATHNLLRHLRPGDRVTYHPPTDTGIEDDLAGTVARWPHTLAVTNGDHLAVHLDLFPHHLARLPISRITPLTHHHQRTPHHRTLPTQPT